MYVYLVNKIKVVLYSYIHKPSTYMINSDIDKKAIEYVKSLML